MDITAIVIGVIISLITIISFFSKFIINQTKMSVQLTQVQIKLAELSNCIVKRDKRIETLEHQMFEIRTKCQFIQDAKKQ